MKKKLVLLSGAVMGFAPLALAQVTGGNPTQCTGGSITTIQALICKFNEILGAILPFLIALGVVYFVFGVITFVISSDEEAKTTGRNRMIYGIIGLVVIIGMWGLVRIVTNTFGLNNTTNINYPTVPY
ncbi:pilin [Patescibacteria group bacterium]|nr:pilin [Patescibacteria group bacterium]